MLPAALRVIRADLRSRPLYTALTGLVVAFALGALVVTLHGRATLDDPYDRLFERDERRARDGGSGSPDALTRIAALPGVASLEGPRPLRPRPAAVPRRGRRRRADRAPAARARVERP